MSVSFISNNDLKSINFGGADQIVSIFLSIFIGKSKGLIPSNISMNGMSAPWYMPLTPFETLFLCFIMFQIFVLRWIEILPINLNNFFHGDPSGRKKRSLSLPLKNEEMCNLSQSRERVTSSMIQLLHKMDEDKCFLRTLCSIENMRSSLEVPTQVHLIFQRLKMLEKYEKNKTLTSQCGDSADPIKSRTNFNDNLTLLRPFQDAIKYGDESQGDIMLCEKKYLECKIGLNETLSYIDFIFQALD